MFPLSNWTEADVWAYIAAENIPVVPLYFAAPRPVVERDGALIMRDDERMALRPGEQVEMRWVRFRTLGCYPLTGAVESRAATLADIIDEMRAVPLLGAPGPRDRPRRRRFDGAEEAGRLFLMSAALALRDDPPSGDQAATAAGQPHAACCASSPAVRWMTASRP